MATERTEYGGDFLPNTLPNKEKRMPLSASEQLRLMYQTGQVTDIKEQPLENWLDPTGPRRTD